MRYVVPKGGTEQVFLTIPVGKVHQKRTFSLKATNEGCTYQSGYLYTITPQITPALSLRIEPEWCNDSGAIYYQLIGKMSIHQIIRYITKRVLKLLIVLTLIDW